MAVLTCARLSLMCCWSSCDTSCMTAIAAQRTPVGAASLCPLHHACCPSRAPCLTPWPPVSPPGPLSHPLAPCLTPWPPVSPPGPLLPAVLLGAGGAVRQRAARAQLLHGVWHLLLQEGAHAAAERALLGALVSLLPGPHGHGQPHRRGHARGPVAGQQRGGE
jgi:hypothetical protein